MPYVLRKAPNRDLYWVVNRDTKTKHSKEPLPKERAEAQRRALYAAENDMKGAGETYREKFYEAYKVEPKSYSLEELSKISKVPKSILQEVYNRGIGAYKTQPKSVRLQHSFVKNVDAPMSAKLSKEMWAMARVYSFLMGNPKHDNDLRANRGGQITEEQIDKYAPTIQAALPEFQPGPEPTHGAYERYKKGVEKSRARGMTTPLMSYDEWANLQRNREEGRQFAVDATKQKVISELPNLIKGYEELEADPLVMCPYDAKGTVQKTSMRKSECKAARDEWEKINHPENYYFFRPAVEGLVKVGDFAAENLLSVMPGIGQVVGEAYKQFAPPESKFYEGSLGQMISGRGKVHYVARRVGGRRVRQIRGRGWFKSAWESAKRFATGAYERAAAVFKGPRQDFSPSVRNTLAQVGNLPVVEMVIRRDPIQSLLNKALNIISLGRWDALRKEYNYDELFHLGVEVTVRLSESNNYTRRYVIEKNEVINVSPAKAYTDKTQTWRVPMAGTTTIDTLLANTKLIMGANFFPYDPFKNNCQDFIWSLLTANGYATPELKAVVKQPMEDLVSKLPGFTGKIARAVTDVGAIANVALEGQGRRGGRKDFEGEAIRKEIAEETAARKAAERAAAKKSRFDDASRYIFDRLKIYKNINAVGPSDYEVAAGSLPADERDEWRESFDELLTTLDLNPAGDILTDLSGIPPSTIETPSIDLSMLAALQGQGREKPTPLERMVQGRNTVLSEIDAATKTYYLAKEVGDEETAANMKDAVKDMKRKLKQGMEFARFRLLPAMAPGAAADWSMPPNKGSGKRGGMRRQAVDVPAAAARLQSEINRDPAYQRAVERRRNVVSALSGVAGILPTAIGVYLGTENIPATIAASAVATFASVLGSLAVDERRRRRQEQRRNEAAIRDYMNSLETTPAASEEGVAYVDPANPSQVFVVEPGQPPAEAVAESTEHVAIPVSVPTEPGTFSVENPMRRGRGKCTCPPGRKTPFQLQLKTAGVCPQKYLELARRVAKKAGYNPEDVEFSDNLDKKLMTYNQAGRRVHFGAVGSGDFLLHSLEGNKKLADEKRDSYLARALKIKGKWRDDRYSPNMLAIQILWDKKR